MTCALVVTEEPNVPTRSLLLQEDEIDIAIAVIQEWCTAHPVDIDSPRGDVAVSETVRLILSGEKSASALADALSRHIELGQSSSPKV